MSDEVSVQTADPRCDCQNPDGPSGVRHVSMECPVHNDLPVEEIAADCAGCTLCCKLLNFNEMAKPAGSWCGACKIGVGCEIYHERPADCRSYSCAWLDCKRQGLPIPEDLRPDRCGVIVESAKHTDSEGRGHNVRVDVGRPEAWTRDHVQAWLTTLFTHGPVFLIRNGKRSELKRFR